MITFHSTPSKTPQNRPLQAAPKQPELRICTPCLQICRKTKQFLITPPSFPVTYLVTYLVLCLQVPASTKNATLAIPVANFPLHSLEILAGSLIPSPFPDLVEGATIANFDSQNSQIGPIKGIRVCQPLITYRKCIAFFARLAASHLRTYIRHLPRAILIPSNIPI